MPTRLGFAIRIFPDKSLPMKLNIENLTIVRGGQEIVSGIGFELHAGEALIVTGENGSGKSTTLKGICGLLPIAEGKIDLFDETGKPFENPVKEYCHYLGHKTGMKPALTVRENLEFWQKFMGDELLSIDEALEEVELSHTIDLPFNYLSAGQKQRVAIAKLLVSDRPIWVLDEPTSGLDAQSVTIFNAIARHFCDEGGILIAATHLPLGFDSAKSLQIDS